MLIRVGKSKDLRGRKKIIVIESWGEGVTKEEPGMRAVCNMLKAANKE